MILALLLGYFFCFPSYDIIAKKSSPPHSAHTSPAIRNQRPPLSSALLFQEKKKYSTAQYSTVQFSCAMAVRSCQGAPSNEHLAFGINGERQG